MNISVAILRAQIPLNFKIEAVKRTEFEKRVDPTFSQRKFVSDKAADLFQVYLMEGGRQIWVGDFPKRNLAELFIRAYGNEPTKEKPKLNTVGIVKFLRHTK